MILALNIFLALATIVCLRSDLKNTLPLILKNEKNRFEHGNTLFVFVGEKIEVKKLPYEEDSMDAGFKAKYKILQKVYGEYGKDVIEFEAYDHYGIPKFSAYKNVLLFLSEYKGKFYHEKYQFADVYMTKTGRWAGTYSDDYAHPYNHNTTIKPQKIEFIEEVSYPLKVTGHDGIEYNMRYRYDEPYFKFIHDRAVAIYGNYLEELFTLKKEGVLAARKVFENTDSEEE